jgi:diguanylate cyclase (GGDEF)-like protein
MTDGEHRDEAADRRDRAGLARDLRGDERDRSADARDGRAVAAEEATESGIGGAERLRAERARIDAASDRSRSSRDRQAGAQERLVAHADRSAAAADREDAEVDELTGAHLRGAGLRELQREMDRARRTGRPLGLAFVDVDHLKDVNDSLGHAAGDQVLRAAVGAMRARMRSYDLVVRVGGDEFLCVLEGLDLAATRRRLSGVNVTLADRPEPAAVTVGVAEMVDGDTPTSLIARADADLYEQRRRRATTAT